MGSMLAAPLPHLFSIPSLDSPVVRRHKSRKSLKKLTLGARKNPGLKEIIRKSKERRDRNPESEDNESEESEVKDTEKDCSSDKSYDSESDELSKMSFSKPKKQVLLGKSKIQGKAAWNGLYHVDTFEISKPWLYYRLVDFVLAKPNPKLRELLLSLPIEQMISIATPIFIRQSLLQLKLLQSSLQDSQTYLLPIEIEKNGSLLSTYLYDFSSDLSSAAACYGDVDLDFIRVMQNRARNPRRNLRYVAGYFLIPVRISIFFFPQTCLMCIYIYLFIFCFLRHLFSLETSFDGSKYYEHHFLSKCKTMLYELNSAEDIRAKLMTNAAYCSIMSKLYPGVSTKLKRFKTALVACFCICLYLFFVCVTHYDPFYLFNLLSITTQPVFDGSMFPDSVVNSCFL